MREFEISPNRELGQNFLVDDNLLGVIERAAELDPGDVVLEVGGGLGVLSEHLAPRVGHLHVVEVDPRLIPPLKQALDPFSNTTLHLANALDLDLGALEPAPDKVVANLPYGVAATVVIETVLNAPAVVLWVAMVQREVAERLAAQPGSRTYGASSAIVGLCCEVKLVRRVGPGVFHPRPNVESALVRLVRGAPPPRPGLVALVHAAFAHRRKALSGSLMLAPNAAPGIREAARAALEGIGHAADARAERLAPADFAALGEALGPELLASLER